MWAIVLLRECYLHLKHKLHAELADGTRRRVLRPDGHLRAAATRDHAVDRWGDGPRKRCDDFSHRDGGLANTTGKKTATSEKGGEV